MSGGADLLRGVVRRNRAGKGVGIWSACSAHPMVLEACVEQAVADGGPLLVEATCNQVNQEGGYTGMRPAGFRAFAEGIARGRGLPPGRLVLGGDHLGPNPWRREPAEAAMAKAEELVRTYAVAGFAKLHLDASMACAGDPEPLPPELVAERAAALCRAAEAAAPEPPVYVVGTEVPVPGGAQESLDGLEVTRVADLARTIEVHRAAFTAAGLEAAWRRVLAVVVQPGVEFGSERVVDLVPERARDLAAFLDGADDALAFEAHSTDYQTEDALRALVGLRFAVLKVGPWLTFALREALFALAAIEAELVDEADRSQLPDIVEATMVAEPGQWAGYYPGDADEQRLARRYSYSDRLRYYWPDPGIQRAQERLLANLAARDIPLPLLSQHLPAQYARVRQGDLTAEPHALVLDHIRDVLRAYTRACTPHTQENP